MHWQPVSSSNLRSVGYDPDTAILEIEFHNGGIYRYSNVPAQVHHGLMRAASHGQYFHQSIKGVYPYSKIA